MADEVSEKIVMFFTNQFSKSSFDISILDGVNFQTSNPEDQEVICSPLT